MVSDMLGKHHEGNRNISEQDVGNIGTAQILDTLKRIGEGHLLKDVGVDKGIDRHAVSCQALEGIQIDDKQARRVGRLADQREHQGNGISCQDADDEGDGFEVFLAVHGAEHGHSQRDQTAQHRKQLVTAGRRGLQIADSVSGKRQTDDGNRGTDDNGGHQLVNPVDADQLDDQRDDHVHQTGSYRTDQQSEVADLHGHGTAEGSRHGAEEGEGRAEEHGASELGEQQVHDGAEACTDQRSGCAHRQVKIVVVTRDDHGHRDGCRHNGKQLLEGKRKQLGEAGLVLDSVDEFHEKSSSNI